MLRSTGSLQPSKSHLSMNKAYGRLARCLTFAPSSQSPRALIPNEILPASIPLCNLGSTQVCPESHPCAQVRDLRSSVPPARQQQPEVQSPERFCRLPPRSNAYLPLERWCLKSSGGCRTSALPL